MKAKTNKRISAVDSQHRTRAYCPIDRAFYLPWMRILVYVFHVLYFVQSTFLSRRRYGRCARTSNSFPLYTCDLSRPTKQYLDMLQCTVILHSIGMPAEMVKDSISLSLLLGSSEDRCILIVAYKSGQCTREWRSQVNKKLIPLNSAPSRYLSCKEA